MNGDRYITQCRLEPLHGSQYDYKMHPSVPDAIDRLIALLRGREVRRASAQSDYPSSSRAILLVILELPRFDDA